MNLPRRPNNYTRTFNRLPYLVFITPPLRREALSLKGFHFTAKKQYLQHYKFLKDNLEGSSYIYITTSLPTVSLP